MAKKKNKIPKKKYVYKGQDLYDEFKIHEVHTNTVSKKLWIENERERRNNYKKII